MIIIILGPLVILFLLIVVGGNRYHQRQQTKAIVRAIKGPNRTPLFQGGWRDPLLRKFLFVVAALVGIVILLALCNQPSIS